MAKGVHLTVEGIARTKLPIKGMKWLSDTDGGRGTGRDLFGRLAGGALRPLEEALLNGPLGTTVQTR